MGDYSQVHDVGVANIAQINDVPVANCGQVNDCTKAAAASGATRWVVGMSTFRVGYAANSDRTSWTFYDMVVGTGHPDAIDLGFGKDSSGNGIYVMSRDSSSKELFVSGTDVTNVADWSTVNLSPNSDITTVRWRAASSGATAGVWIAVGQQSNKKIYRSTDGASSWTAIDLSGLTGHNTDKIKGIDGDGTGKWMFGQEDRIYYSTDDGANWAVSTPFSGDTGENAVHEITGIKYTNASWVITYEVVLSGVLQAKTYIRSCAETDITDWSDGVDTGAPNHITGNTPSRTSIASSNGRIAIVPHKSPTVARADINGKTISNVAAINKASDTGSNDRFRDIECDGSTWMIVTLNGDVYESTDNAESWSKTLDDMGSTNATGGVSGDDSIAVTCDVFGPL